MDVVSTFKLEWSRVLQLEFLIEEWQSGWKIKLQISTRWYDESYRSNVLTVGWSSSPAGGPSELHLELINEIRFNEGSC